MRTRLKTIRSIPTLPPRRRDAHKGDFGRVLIVGGSLGMVGAPALAANAALRSGAGLVKIASPRCNQQATATLAPCATSIPLPFTANGVLSTQAVKLLKPAADGHDVLAIGPGMGQGPGVRKVVTTLLGLPAKPKVVDADGLNALAESGQWWRATVGPIVLTPHPGEMRRLIAGAKLQVDAQDRQACAAAYSGLTKAVVLLKGAGTIVTDARRVYINKTGNPGMATAGAGDVLTGLIAALIGQHVPAFEAAVLGAHLHGLAGDLAADELGQVSLTASDLVDYLPEAFALV
jgi:ADP-dependent NAD(P)H-hydrate dehydratase